MDVRHTEGIPSQSMDMAIDKATMESMVHGSMWNPPDDVCKSMGATVSELSRVLKPGGLFLYITFIQAPSVMLVLNKSPPCLPEHPS